MANPILDSHMPTSSNTILNSHGWPNNTSGNALLVSHGDPYVEGADTYPDAFYFADIAGTVALSTNTQSVETITVAGITAAAAITISGSGGSLHQYSKNGTAYKSTADTVVAGDTVRIQHTSSGSNSTAATTTLTIGGRSDTFTSTTVAGSGFSAVLNTGTGVMTITGSGFGTKSPAAPLYFEPVRGYSNGATATAIGMDFYDGEIQPIVENGIGIGGGSLYAPTRDYADTGELDSIFHVGVDLPNLTELYASMWCRHDSVQIGGGAGTLQQKFIRAGRYDAGNGFPHYGPAPKVQGSLWLPPSGAQSTANGAHSFIAYFDSDNVENSGYANWEAYHDPDNPNGVLTPNENKSAPYPTALQAWGQWFHCEVHHKLNTVGQTNGHLRIRANAKLIVEVKNASIRLNSSSDHTFQYVNFLPLLDNTAGYDLNTYTTRFYADSTPMRVFLGNASTYGACTGCFLLPPTDWSDTSITVTHGLDIPSGYSYLYAIDASGAQIQLNGSMNGFAFSTV